MSAPAAATQATHRAGAVFAPAWCCAWLAACGGAPALDQERPHELERPADDLDAEALATLAAQQATGCPAAEGALPPPDALGARSCADRAPADFRAAEFQGGPAPQLHATLTSYGSAACLGQAVTEITGAALLAATSYAWALPTTLTSSACSGAWSTTAVWVHDARGYRLAGRYGFVGIAAAVGDATAACAFVPLGGSPALSVPDIAEGPRTFADVALSDDRGLDRMRVVTALFVGCEPSQLDVYLDARGTTPGG